MCVEKEIVGVQKPDNVACRSPYPFVDSLIHSAVRLGDDFRYAVAVCVDYFQRPVIARAVDDDILDNLEEILITSDVGVETTLRIIERIEQRVARDKYLSTSELKNILREEIVALLTENNTGDENDFVVPAGATRPYVIMVVGVNGVGKTLPVPMSSWWWV